MRPARRLWLRNCSPSVAEICSLDSSWIGNGSEPNFRTVTSSFASFCGKPPIVPAVIWMVLSGGMKSLMTGAEMTVLSRVIAKYSPV